MRRRIVTSCVALTLVMLPGLSPAPSAADRTDRVITLLGSDATVGIGDLNEPGPTPGDIRTLSLALTNTRGQPAGRAEIVQTLTRQAASIGTAVKVVVLVLPRGMITGIGQTEFTDLTDPQGRPADLVERIAITGGTRAYRSAAGQIDVKILPDFTSRWTISLDR